MLWRDKHRRNKTNKKFRFSILRSVKVGGVYQAAAAANGMNCCVSYLSHNHPMTRPLPPPPRRKTGSVSLGKAPNLNRNSFGRRPTIDGNPRRSNSQSNVASPDGSSLGLVQQETSSRFEGYSGAKVVEGVHVTHGGDEAAGGGSSRAPASNPGGSDFVKRGVSPGVGSTADVEVGAAVGGVGVGVGEGMGDGGDVPRNSSMEESGGTNPLFNTVAPLSASGQGSQSVSERCWCFRPLRSLCTALFLSRFLFILYFFVLGRAPAVVGKVTITRRRFSAAHLSF